ncbi:hypothetical protein QYF36_024677 [Acer negundo]|nr:hypothetical protein QYF36_024677 [Acer negundo]
MAVSIGKKIEPVQLAVACRLNNNWNQVVFENYSSLKTDKKHLKLERVGCLVICYSVYDSFPGQLLIFYKRLTSCNSCQELGFLKFHLLHIHLGLVNISSNSCKNYRYYSSGVE